MKKWLDNFNKLGDSIGQNVAFVLTFLGIVVGVFLLAFLLEKLAQKHRGVKEKTLTTRKIAMIGMFSAMAGLLMLADFQIPFIAPSFYELDFSELPVLICGFAFGPVAGVITEFLKILIKLMFKSTSTAFVGELANFAVGCTLVIPATTIYFFRKKKLNAILGCVVGTICMTVFGTAFNAIYLLPTFAKMYHMPLEVIIAMGTKIHPAIGTSIVKFVIFCVAPLNIIKGTAVSVVTMLVYKPLSPLIHSNTQERRQKKASANQ